MKTGFVNLVLLHHLASNTCRYNVREAASSAAHATVGHVLVSVDGGALATNLAVEAEESVDSLLGVCTAPKESVDIGGLGREGLSHNEIVLETKTKKN